MPILFLRDIHLTFGGTPLLTGADLYLSEGDRLALVGRNGSGKSTLLKIAAGIVEPDSGERFVQPGVTLRYLPQEPDLSGFETALDYVLAGLGPADDRHHAEQLLEKLGLNGSENPAQLSGGEARRCALVRALAPRPDILLLDEPTNHLDLPTIEWLEDELRASRSALVLISHDRRFLENLSSSTLWLSGGAVRHLNRSFAFFEAWRDRLLEQQEREDHKLKRKIVAEMEWLHKGVTARRKRNQGRLRALQDLRADWKRRARPVADVSMQPGEAERSGKRVIEAIGISKRFDGAPVVRDLSVRIQRGDRLGIVGPNGAGKTTLINLLTGALTPDEGRIRRGTNLELATLDQRRESLDPEDTLSDVLTGGDGDRVSVGGQSRHVIGYMKDFLFAPEQARTPVRALSGGERGRLMLARALARPSNLLVLDEPTNDLDLETLDLLQEMLADYKGTVLLASHDRDFLDRVVTATIAWQGDGRWIVYAGGYSDMIAQRGSDVAPTAGAARKKPTRRKKDGARAAQAKAPRPGLTFKEKHALEKLPARLDALQGEIDRQQAVLADAELFARDPQKFETAAAALQKAQEDHADAEEEWLLLEMKREEADEA